MLHIHKIIHRNYQARKALVCNKGGIYKRTFHKHSKNSEWETSSVRSSTWNSSNFGEIKYQSVFGRFIELVSHELIPGSSVAVLVNPQTRSIVWTASRRYALLSFRSDANLTSAVSAVKMTLSFMRCKTR